MGSRAFSQYISSLLYENPLSNLWIYLIKLSYSNFSDDDFHKMYTAVIYAEL